MCTIFICINTRVHAGVQDSYVISGGNEALISGARELMHETAAAYVDERKSGADIPEISFMYEGSEVILFILAELGLNGNVTDYLSRRTG